MAAEQGESSDLREIQTANCGHRDEASNTTRAARARTAPFRRGRPGEAPLTGSGPWKPRPAPLSSTTCFSPARAPRRRAGAPRPAVSMQTDEALRALLQRFYALQGERVETYRLFEEGHRAYLSSAPHYDFPRYRQLVHEITAAFSGISREVLQLRGRLRGELGRPDLAQHLTRLQEREQEKLQLVSAGHGGGGRLIKTIEAISEILQDLKYDSEEAE
uniref:Required for excision 1-B domain containing n=1 Tax=Coturnix japonica TaxID=93934 RepID=A0A8C2TKR7_COTJA